MSMDTCKRTGVVVYKLSEDRSQSQRPYICLKWYFNSVEHFYCWKGKNVFQTFPNLLITFKFVSWSKYDCEMMIYFGLSLLASCTFNIYTEKEKSNILPA